MDGHLFISYTQRDRPYVESLAGWLREAGLTPWWFEEDESHTGGMFTEMLMPAITEAGAVIVVLSQHSANSRGVTQEVLFAGRQRKLLITILLEECEGSVRFLLSPDNWIDARQIGNPVPRIQAALAADSQILPLAYLVAAEGYEALVRPRFITLEAVQYQRAVAAPGQVERTLCTIGTLPSNTLVINPRGGLVSRSHAHIGLRIDAEDAPTFLLYDTSRNGTFVNEIRITGPQPLEHGDYIGLAKRSVLLQFLRYGETSTTSRLGDVDLLTR